MEDQETEADVYVNIKVDRFNIEFSGIDKDSEFPLTNWMLSLRPWGKWWQKTIYILFAWPFILTAMLIDMLVINLLYFGMIKYCGRKIIDAFFDTFLKKVLGIGAFVIIGFIVFVMIKSGLWQKFFGEVVKLFS